MRTHPSTPVLANKKGPACSDTHVDAPPLPIEMHPMAKAFAPSFGDRPPAPPKKCLPEFEDDDDCDDFVVELELDGDEYVRRFDVSQRLMEWLDDGEAPGADDKHHAK